MPLALARQEEVEAGESWKRGQGYPRGHETTDNGRAEDQTQAPGIKLDRAIDRMDREGGLIGF